MDENLTIEQATAIIRDESHPQHKSFWANDRNVVARVEGAFSRAHPGDADLSGAIMDPLQKQFDSFNQQAEAKPATGQPIPTTGEPAGEYTEASLSAELQKVYEAPFSEQEIEAQRREESELREAWGSDYDQNLKIALDKATELFGDDPIVRRDKLAAAVGLFDGDGVAAMKALLKLAR